jgi:RNA polymerase sigma-70 factor (ECF subfamily)
MKPDSLRLLSPSLLPSPPEIKAIARSDRRRAMGLVAEKYRARLYNHALYIVKDHQEAYDIIQEVFIKAIHEHRFFDDDFKMKAWLFRVASNLCFNIIRNRKRRGTILENVRGRDATEADQLERVFSGERQGRILSAMDKLSRNHREILMLRYYSDLSYAEISDALGIKLGTVMSRLSRAKNKLMEVLDDPGVVER